MNAHAHAPDERMHAPDERMHVRNPIRSEPIRHRYVRMRACKENAHASLRGREGAWRWCE
eukprot:5365668-Pleurochrysis_carterae.AAC.2